MFKFSEKVLRQGYTIYISKRNDIIQGTYLQSFQDGIHAFELPVDEIAPLTYFDTLLSSIEAGALLQVRQSGPQITGTIGLKKTEGPYCETEYLEVLGEKRDFDYVDTLIGLDASLKETNKGNVIQYTKLYKGVDRYE